MKLTDNLDKVYEANEIALPFYCPREGGPLSLWLFVREDFTTQRAFKCNDCGRLWEQEDDGQWNEGEGIANHNFSNDEFWIRIIKKGRNLFEIGGSFETLKEHLKKTKNDKKEED